ncbi:MAG: hypothetical protein ACLTA7_01860 [Ruminococcus sp.]
MTKTGEDGDWIQIDFEGKEGYVREIFFSRKSSYVRI